MEFRVLEYFLAIARVGTISGAAEMLHITQPTLSRQIKALEDEIGKPLFIRGSKNLTLTEEGILLRKRAEEITALVDKTMAEVTEDSEDIGGTIYLGSGETQAFRLVAKVIARLQKEYPNIHFDLFSGNAQNVTEKIDQGLLDFGILIEPTDLTKYDFIKLPSTDRWSVVMRKDAELASKEFITPEDIKDKPVLLSNQHTVKNEIAGWIGGNSRKLNIVDNYNLIYNAAILVEETGYYALTIDGLVDNNPNLVFKPLKPKLEVGLDIVWKKYQVFSKAGEVFLEALKKEIEKESQH